MSKIDRVEFKLGEYIFKLSKKKRLYNFQGNSNYQCSIIIENLIGVTILEINTNEIDYVYLLESLTGYLYNPGEILSDNVYFRPITSNFNSFIISFQTINNIYTEDTIISKLTISDRLYNGYLVKRLELILDNDTLDLFILDLYKLVSDIEYLDDLFKDSSLLEYICSE